jgi:hypothetical protein
MTRRGVLAWLGGILLVAAVLAPGALAGKPTFERITVDETFADDFLTGACGVPVTTHAEGHVKINPETEEVLHEPQANREDRVEDACAALTA